MHLPDGMMVEIIMCRLQQALREEDEEERFGGSTSL